ncbi:MAG: TIM barrel protein [Nocardioides sp.]|uniref:sugar phosphate isomerase/epimerase family protein n=1 Tax=Nocardioides sp. TaxID=35761 RepID=UPI0039E562B9
MSTATAQEATRRTLGQPVQGVTLYSFTRFFHSRGMSFTELVREVARRGLGPTLEIVGFQAIKGFPEVSEEFEREFRSVIDETGLVPSSFGANADAGLRRDRMLTSDELVEYMERQIAAARRLGFPIVRVQYGLTPDDMERLLPVAERHDVTLGMEIHAHHTPGHPTFQALLERFSALGSPRLGFIPDWGATMTGVPPTLLRAWRAKGMSEPLIAALEEFSADLIARGAPRSDEEQGARMEQAFALAHSFGEQRLAIEVGVDLAGLFGRGRVEEWAEVMPWVVHTHGKFYEIDADGEEPSVPIPEIMALYVEHGYDRTISSEWEGFHWNDWEDAFDVIAAQQALLRRSAERAGSRLVTDPVVARERLDALNA